MSHKFWDLPQKYRTHPFRSPSEIDLMKRRANGTEYFHERVMSLWVMYNGRQITVITNSGTVLLENLI